MSEVASLPRAEVRTESDGSVLVCHSRRDVPLVVVEIQSPGGRASEPEELPGLAELAAELLAEGPAGVTPEEWRRRTEGLAAEIVCAARYDHWAVRFECLSENLEEACGLLKRLLVEPGLPESEFKRLVKARRAGAREEWAQPVAVIRRLSAVQNLGFAHPLAHPPFEKAYARASHAAAAQLAGNAFRRGGGVYALIGGDLEAEAGFGRLREILAALPESDGAAPVEPPVAPSAAPVWICENPKVDQAFFALGREGVRAGDPDRVALRLANYLIGGGGFESRLMSRVREEAGGTYGISSSLAEQRMASPFTISSFTKLDRLAEMLGIVERTLAEVVAEGFTAEELEVASSNRFGALPLRLTSPRAVLGHAVAGLRSGISPEELERDWLAYRSTSLQEVNAAAKRIVGDAEFRLAVIGPGEQVGSEVAGRGRADRFKFGPRPDLWPR
jgi:zinc protease